MSNRTYRVTEIVGTSSDGVTEAIENGIERAGKTLRHLDWFEVEQIRGHIVDTDVEHYQVTMKLGFRLEGTLREDCIVDGVVSDSWVYGLLRRDWQMHGASAA